MKSIFHRILFICVLPLTAAGVFGQSSIVGRPPNPAEKIEISSQIPIKITPLSENSISLAVTVPDNYHLYLSHVNSQSFSILTEITLGEVRGIKLLEVIKPAGEREGNEMILRGNGNFTLSISVDGTYRTGDLIELPLKLSTQLCNEINGTCFPPVTIDRSLTLKFTDSTEFAPINSDEIEWAGTIARGRELADRTGKNMFIFITAPSWCSACMAMEEHTIPDTDFITFINRYFVPVLVPDEKNGETNADLFEYEFGWSYPSYLVVSPTETVLYKDAGYVSAGQLIGELGPYTSELNQENTEDYEAGADTEEMDWGGVTYSELARMQENYLKNHARQYTKQSIAAFRYSDGVGCAILGDGRFVLWSLDEYAQVIEGFPKDLKEFWPDLHPYRNKILGALTLSNNKYYVFLDDGTYLRFTYGTRALDSGFPQKVSENTWPGLAPYAERIRAAFLYPHREKIYFFLDGKEYLRYDISDDMVESGYPKPVNNNTWEGLEAYGPSILSSLNDGGDITYFFTRDANMIQFSLFRDEVIAY